MPCDMQDLISLTRDRTHTPFIGRVESATGWPGNSHCIGVFFFSTKGEGRNNCSRKLRMNLGRGVPQLCMRQEKMQDLAGAGVLQYKATRSAQRRWPCGSVPMTWTSSPLSRGDYGETEC